MQKIPFFIKLLPEYGFRSSSGVMGNLLTLFPSLMVKDCAALRSGILKIFDYAQSEKRKPSTHS